MLVLEGLIDFGREVVGSYIWLLISCWKLYLVIDKLLKVIFGY